MEFRRRVRLLLLFPLFFILQLLLQLPAAHSATVRFDWKVQFVNVTRLCHTKSLVSINGQFPGPTAHVREGDLVIVNVTNLVPYNVTIHWHGIRQLLSAWADGPAYITQCPIQTGKSYVHKFRVIDQRGTLFYHAHFSWLRATVYGAIIISPKVGIPIPFSTPTSEIPILIGEWWNSDTEQVIAQALAVGGAYNVSDAITINGQPGLLYGNCSLNDTPVFNVTSGKTYLLRIINAAVNFHMYVGVASHNLTVVELDAEYAQPYTTSTVVVAPGQTTSVLLKANQKAGQYLIAASVFSPLDPRRAPYPKVPAVAVLRYTTAGANATLAAAATADLPRFPAFNDTAYVAEFTQALRGQPYSKGFYYYEVPQTVDEDLFFTISYATQPCSTCKFLIPDTRLAGSINNITFKQPSLSLLQAYYNHINGTFDTDFPSSPLFQYNFTGPSPSNLRSVFASKVKVLDFGSNVQIVFQDTSSLAFESHPMHLHGQNFYIVGTGFGTFNNVTDPPKFNLKDPPSRNTVAVPSGGWAAVRFRTTNPGVWFLHCHFDIHSSWGMSMAFIVKNGIRDSETLPPPPPDLPLC